ncbi:MAG: acetyl-CoA synthetase, partial [Acidobacteria bacterium]|nr:acetyl-CoA synthetase [Acidobacteriota bacterium]
MSVFSRVAPMASFGRTVLLLAVSVAAGLTQVSADDGGARLLRYPSIHDDFVVFVYAGDIWRAPVEGGQAWRLTSHNGVELTPKISPDGHWVAYSAEYSGGRQVYVIPASGGEPKQLTFYNDVGLMPPRGGFDYWIQGWRADGKILVRMNRTPWGRRPGRLFVVDPAGGLEQPLPIPVAGSASYSPDASRVAYTYFDREFRTWKRYQGGRNQDIWTLDLESMESRRLTDWAGSDNFPMWHEETIYFTSDREHTLNLFAHDLATDTTRQVTNFDEYDVLWPSLGSDAIVFMNGGWIYRLDLATEEVAKIPLTIGNDLPATVPHWEDVDDNIAAADLAPGGKRAVFEARGDLFTVPAKDGATRNLTRTQGVRESEPAWSPDGRWIAYYSDAEGEMGLMVRSQDGSGEPRVVAAGAPEWRYPARWSPDGDKLAFGNSNHELLFVDVDGGELTRVDADTQGDIDTYSWSPDSRWLVYEKSHPETRLPSLAVYSLETGQAEILGDGLTFDFGPVFSADGDYLFFLSNRDYNLNFSDFEFNFVYDDATRIYAAPLDSGAEPLFPLASDEVEIDGDDDEEDDDADDEEAEPSVSVTVAGFAARVVALPGLEAGNYGGLSPVEGGVLFLQFGDGEPALMHYDLEEREAEEIASAVEQYAVGANGEHVLYRSGD